MVKDYEKVETVWSRDDKITEMMLEYINDGNTMKVKGVYEISLGLYDSAWNIIFQQMVNLYGGCDEEDKEMKSLRSFEEDYEKLFEQINSVLTPQSSVSVKHQQELNAQRKHEIENGLGKLNRLIWEGMNFAGLFLQTRKVFVPKHAIREAE